MTGKRAEIAARLLGSRESSGGGLALSGAFREILTFLLEQGPGNDQDMLKVLRGQLGFKEKRILSEWGSWDTFRDDIMQTLAFSGYVQRMGDFWATTDKVITMRELTIIREDTEVDGTTKVRKISCTVYPPQMRADRERIAGLQQKINDLISELNGTPNPDLSRAKRDLHGIAERLNDALFPARLREPVMPDPDPEQPRETVETDDEESPFVRAARTRRPPGERKRGQHEWYSAWVRTVGWHTQSDAVEMWNMLYPDKALESLNASSFRHVAKAYIERGLMERRVCARRDGRINPGGDNGRGGSFEYRWTGG